MWNTVELNYALVGEKLLHSSKHIFRKEWADVWEAIEHCIVHDHTLATFGK